MLALAILVVGWFILISPQRSHASSLRGQAVTQQQANVVLQQKISTLSKQAAGVAQSEARIADIATELPSTPQLAAYVRDLSQAATQAHVDLVSIAASPPTAVANPTPAPHAASTTPSSNGASAPAAAPAAAAAESVPLQAITLGLNVNGSYYAIQQYLSKLEQLRRLTLVTVVSLAPGSPLKPESNTATAATDSSTATDTVPQWKTLNGQLTVTIFEAGVGPNAAVASTPPGAPAVAVPTGAAASSGAGPRPAPSGSN